MLSFLADPPSRRLHPFTNDTVKGQGPGVDRGALCLPGGNRLPYVFLGCTPLPEPSRKEVEEKPWEVCCGAG